jgi:hypothetical protein
MTKNSVFLITIFLDFMELIIVNLVFKKILKYHSLKGAEIDYFQMNVIIKYNIHH